ncbi:TonB-dependent receptor [Asticcacaulis endophyticus]|uniref:TonB-dependent receptor n=2 Tax=Asticcacaulis endophyticus TaxID=1395890 RepID=A0A918UYU8_9CAUL|nr:TonB-dependent receptor [Asticcacaulis endophyticus]
MLCGSVSALAMSALMGPAFAQVATPDSTASATEDTTEVVVTAIRRSLRNAQTIKRDSDVIVDSITAEDIGALPDRSVTEALQRVPGVSINRFSAGVDPDHFSSEGSGVTVRGLNMTRSELNGRDTFSANNGRQLSFADVPAELMGGVDVVKNPSADMIEGGIAGTVNLRTRVPFDAKGQVISFSAEGSYGDFAKKWTPTYSALYSNRWDTELGEFGLLLNYVNSELTTRSDGAQLSNYSCRTNVQTYDTGSTTGTPVVSPNVDCNGDGTADGIYYPRGAAMRSQISDRTREGYGLAAQWRSNDDTMLATFQFLRSEATQAWTEHAIEIATDNVSAAGDSFPVYGTDVTFDGDGVFTEGVLSSNSTGWRADIGSADPLNRRTPKYGAQSNNIRRDQQQSYVTEDYGFNLRWTPNDRWGFKFDAQHVKSSVDVIDNTIWGSTFQNVSIKRNGDDIPTFAFLPPTRVSATGVACDPTNPQYNGDGCGLAFTGDHTEISDPYNHFWRAAMDHFEQSEGTEDALRADAEYLFEENNFLQSFQFGVRWSERDQTTRFSQYNWGPLSEVWGGSGPVWMDETFSNGQSSAGNIENFTFDNFMGGDIANPVAAGIPYYANNAVDGYEAFRAFGLAIGDTFRNRYQPISDQDPTLVTCRDGVTPRPQNWVPVDMRCDTIPGTPYLLNEVNPVTETNNAAYAMIKYRHEMDNGWRIGGNIGLRYTKTERVSSGYESYNLGSFSTDTTCAIPPNTGAGQTVTVFCSLDPAVRQDIRNFQNGALTPITSNTEYRYLLPSFNLKVQPNTEWVFRLGLSETLNAPEIGLLRFYKNYSLDTNNATSIINGRPRGNVGIGNPELKPAHSTNIDLSAEWYFAPVGSLTLALFHKELTDVITNDTQLRSLTNNGETFDLIVSQPVNSPDKAKLKGFELAYQQTYDFLPSPFDGLGVNANYSYIDSSNVPQSTLSATDPDVAAGRVTVIDTSLLPLQGLSEHNANFTVFYEKYGISARLAYNWRDDFLITVRDVIVPYQPIMQEASGQLDGSLFYSVTPQIKVGVQGVNLTNEVTKTAAVLNNDLLTAGRSWFMNDRRVTFVIRGTF